MKKMTRFAIIAVAPIFMLLADVSLLTLQFVPEANAIFGVRRRAARRGVIVGYAAGEAAASSAAASQAAATSQQQAATTQQQTSAATTPSSPPATTGKTLPLGTVVSSLPEGCTSKPVGGVEYYHCGGNYYRAVFQGNNLVYVTAKP